MYLDGHTVVYPESSCESKRLFNVYRMFRQNCFTRRKFVSGALYGFLYDNLVQIISPKKGKIIRLIVMLKSSDGKAVKYSQVKIVYDPSSTGKYLVACNSLAKSLSSKAGITCRHNQHDLGKMRVFGYGKKQSGENGIYKITYQNRRTEDDISKVAQLCRQYYSECGLQEEIRDIEENSNNPIIPLMKGCICSRIVQSENLMNSAHFDVNDTSRCIATFTEQKVGEASGWYFILPNVTIDGKRGIAIELHHGVTVAWDGRVIWHCSSVSDIKPDNSVHGTFVAA